MLSIVAVSIDAARAETYEQLRRPGKWAPLMKNVAFLSSMRRENRFPNFWFNFVVQQANFREMLDFIALADAHAVDSIWFQRAVNYGAYDESTFAAVNVCAPTHPEHPELLEILRNPLFKRPSINIPMLMSLLPEVVASDERIESLY
jgi:wyosine [tRNA(Phe)-imidazoG37] synthetase (radical SAM superfamily)